MSGEDANRNAEDPIAEDHSTEGQGTQGPRAGGPSKAVWWLLGLGGCGVVLVPCIGILAAIAVPAFINYLTRAKMTEAETHLPLLFQGAALYYDEEHVGPDGQVLTHCLVESAVTPAAPGPETSLLPPLGPSFSALSFSPLDPVYYQYEIVSLGGCGHEAGEEPLYTFRAIGDLDGDGVRSTFEIAAGADEENVLFRPVYVYRDLPRE